MIVTYSFCKKDALQAMKNLKWIRDMGNVSSHDIILIVPEKFDVSSEINIASDCFNRVHCCPIPACDTQWPFPCNWHFINAVRIVETLFSVPFMWLEPDA